MKWTPIRNLLIIKVPKPQSEEKTDGGIVVMKSQFDAPDPVGEVVALGPQVDPELQITVGTHVMFEPLHAFDVESNDKDFEYLAIRDEYIMCRKSA